MLTRSTTRAERPRAFPWTKRSIFLIPILLIMFYTTVILNVHGETQLPYPAAETSLVEEGEGVGTMESGVVVAKGAQVGLFAMDPSRFELKPVDGDQTATDGPPPLFVFQNAEDLKSGAVETWFSGDEVLFPGMTLNLKNNTRTLMIEAKRLGTQLGDMSATYSIQLLGGRTDRLIVQEERMITSAMPRLIWAGDLNRDGKMDLILNMEREEGETHMLYLSSGLDQDGIAVIRHGATP